MLKHQVWMAAAAWLLLSRAAFAVPTFQVYIEAGTAGSIGQDEDSWFTTNSAFNLIVVGAYGPKTEDLSNVTLALSVPKGQTGTISIAGGDGVTLVTSNADTNLLTDVAGLDGYSDKSFLPVGFNEHYPFKADVCNFLIYDIGSFDNVGPVHNYNAADGTITQEGSGEEKIFNVSLAGFSQVHFDVYGCVQQKNPGSKWEINPASHDCSTFIPAPGAVVLASVGLCLVGWLRRRRTL